MSRRPLAVVLALAAAAALVVAGPGEGARPRDRVWTRAGIAQYPLRRIAFLPVADLVLDKPRRARLVEEQWLLHFIDDGHDWVPPEICSDFMTALARPKPDSVANAVRMQVLRGGQLDSTRVSLLARVLRSQALLTVRIDRMERVAESDPRDVTAHVELTAALVDSTGRLLWRMSGEQALRVRSGVPQGDREHVPTDVLDQVVLPEMDLRTGSASTTIGRIHHTESSGVSTVRLPEGGTAPGRDFTVALDGLLQRWLSAYPWTTTASPRAAASARPSTGDTKR